MGNEIKNIGVVGLGVMGFDIAFLYALKGFRTLVYDTAPAVMNAVEDRREQTIERLRKRNRISNTETDQVRTLLVKSSNLQPLSGMNLITEAVSENPTTKVLVYRA